MAKTKEQPVKALHVCPRCGWRQAYTVQEAADALGVSDQTIRNYVKAGRLPAETDEVSVPGGGFRYWIPVEAVEALKNGGRTA